MSNVNITLGILSLIFLVTILVLAVSWRRLCNKLGLVTRQQTEIDHFLDLFSRSLRSNDELSDSMHQAAKHIAELIMADAVCIYRLENDHLMVSGVSGTCRETKSEPFRISSKVASSTQNARAASGSRK